ncbi:hypothetical protein STRIP9103_02165 [Streptomyces ipomoeae 91-03]|uniref:Uncharacterized protein n=1 Tax=Streptomyces ipomoeae 91-03 TaxID=698759 RepID=L1L1J8_9ACTN|nr:hypothetical protein STRIP9103_02165 [Streptomyces ipomoeae 91-03]
MDTITSRDRSTDFGHPVRPTRPAFSARPTRKRTTRPVRSPEDGVE